MSHLLASVELYWRRYAKSGEKRKRYWNAVVSDKFFFESSPVSYSGSLVYLQSINYLCAKFHMSNSRILEKIVLWHRLNFNLSHFLIFGKKLVTRSEFYNLWLEKNDEVLKISIITGRSFPAHICKQTTDSVRVYSEWPVQLKTVSWSFAKPW